ncbi:MAG: hypothetical protein LUD52_06935 [Opitutae bacterium]|nr:hypothetical protein [Opitutae bacterium]
MRKLLAILACASVFVCFGCASNGNSTRSPWSAGSSRPAAPAASAPDEGEKSDDNEVVAAPDGEGDGDFKLGENLREAVEAEGANMIANASATEVIPPPREGKMLVMTVEPSLSLVEFKSVEQFKKGDRITFYKNMKPGVLAVVGEPKPQTYQPPVSSHGDVRDPVKFWVYTAEEVRGVIESPEIEVEDELVCTPFVDHDKPSKDKVVARCPHCGQPLNVPGSGIGDASAAVDDEDEDEAGSDDEEEDYSDDSDDED